MLVGRNVVGDASVYPIRKEDINFMRLLGVSVGGENQPLAIRRELREGIEATGEGNALELRAVAIHPIKFELACAGVLVV